MSSSPQNMDWRAEAEALIRDMQAFVRKIEISKRQESSDMRIYFDLETIEGEEYLISMDSCGFTICDEIQQNELQTPEAKADSNDPSSANRPPKIYETINALLDENSLMYRRAFAQALIDKIQYIE